MDTVISILAFLLIIGVLIFVHEFGHFWVARRNGIKVEEFAFGLPLLPRIFSLKRGETTYSIYPVPIGGFVKMLGEEGESKSKRSFAAKSAGVRARVLVAGVVMNALLAYLLLTVAFLFHAPPVAFCASDIPNATYQNEVTVAALTDGGPADSAGVKKGDVVRSIGGESVDCQVAAPGLITPHAGEATPFQVSRDGTEQTISVTPRGSGALKGKVGIAFQDNYEGLSYPRWEAPYLALIDTVALIGATLAGVAGLFGTIFTQATVPAGVAGPVGLAQLTGDLLGQNVLVILRFMAIISLSLAVFNLIPIPALDGGRLLFVGIEKLRRGKPVPAAVEQYIHLAGFVFLVGLILFITYFDIIR